MTIEQEAREMARLCAGRAAALRSGEDAGARALRLARTRTSAVALSRLADAANHSARLRAAMVVRLIDAELGTTN